jgi:hypothetical protein
VKIGEIFLKLVSKAMSVKMMPKERLIFLVFRIIYRVHGAFDIYRKRLDLFNFLDYVALGRDN